MAERNRFREIINRKLRPGEPIPQPPGMPALTRVESGEGDLAPDGLPVGVGGAIKHQDVARSIVNPPEGAFPGRVK